MLRDGVSNHKVYLAAGFTDMRKSIDGLSAIVQLSFELDPFSSAYFVFCGSSRDRLKILHWEHNGFWLYYRRLEKGKFHWPKTVENDCATAITFRQLRWLLDGLNINNRIGHKEFIAKTSI
ncbi:MAG: IS66 family insertion sequence element accessory protein TnpB [Bacilli bacterium]